MNCSQFVSGFAYLDAGGVGCGGALLYLAGHVLALLLHALNRHVLAHILAHLRQAQATQILFDKIS
jgi:hypothetical protein